MIEEEPVENLMNSRAEFGGNPIPRINIENKYEEKKRIEKERNREKEEELAQFRNPNQSDNHDNIPERHTDRKRRKCDSRDSRDSRPESHPGPLEVLDNQPEHTQHVIHQDAPAFSTLDRATQNDISLKENRIQMSIRSWTQIGMNKAKHGMLNFDTDTIRSREADPSNTSQLKRN